MPTPAQALINNDVPADWVQGTAVEGTFSMDGDVMLSDPDTIGTVHYRNGLTATFLVSPFPDAQEAVCERGQIVVYNTRQTWELRRLHSDGNQRYGDLVAEPFPEFDPYSTTLWVIEDLVNALDTGGPTRGGVRVARSGDEQTFAFVESHVRDGVRVELPLKNSTLRLARNPQPRQPMFEPPVC